MKTRGLAAVLLLGGAIATASPVAAATPLPLTPPPPDLAPLVPFAEAPIDKPPITVTLPPLPPAPDDLPALPPAAVVLPSAEKPVAFIPAPPAPRTKRAGPGCRCRPTVRPKAQRGARTGGWRGVAWRACMIFNSTRRQRRFVGFRPVGVVREYGRCEGLFASVVYPSGLRARTAAVNRPAFQTHGTSRSTSWAWPARDHALEHVQQPR